MISKIALGTVQFGLDYGINNTRGKVSIADVSEILNYCDKVGIELLDTAIAYGESEAVLGETLKKNNLEFEVVSKLPHGENLQIKELIDESCRKLNSDKLYGFLFHSFADFVEKPELFDELIEVRNSGKVCKIGFSLYSPKEAEELLRKGIEFDLAQVPYSIFDQRFESVFDKLRQNKVEIHTRSTFLQGLFFKDANGLPNHFLSIKDKLENLQKLFEINEIPLACGLLNFALLNEEIDKVVIGVDGIDNLKQNLKALDYLEATRNIYRELKDFREDSLDIILPTLWKNIS